MGAFSSGSYGVTTTLLFCLIFYSLYMDDNGVFHDCVPLFPINAPNVYEITERPFAHEDIERDLVMYDENEQYVINIGWLLGGHDNESKFLRCYDSQSGDLEELFIGWRQPDNAVIYPGRIVIIWISVDMDTTTSCIYGISNISLVWPNARDIAPLTYFKGEVRGLYPIASLKVDFKTITNLPENETPGASKLRQTENGWKILDELVSSFPQPPWHPLRNDDYPFHTQCAVMVLVLTFMKASPYIDFHVACMIIKQFVG